MLGRNPVPCAASQIQKAICIIPKNILDRCILWRIEHHTCDMETECFSLGINDLHFVTDMQVAEIPKDSWVSTRTIKVSSNHGAPPFAWARTCIVPSYTVPGILHGRFHIAILSNSYCFNGGVDTYCRND